MFDVINLMIGLAGVGIGVAGVVLAVRAQRSLERQFKESGSVVEVSLQAVLVADRDPPTEGISIRVRNTGRLGVSVTGWGVELPNKYTYIYWRPLPGNPKLDHRIEPGDEARWWLPLDALRRGLVEQGLGECEVPMFVTLGTGERVVTEHEMSVAPQAAA
jgi:hypothetical protein